MLYLEPIRTLTQFPTLTIHDVETDDQVGTVQLDDDNEIRISIKRNYRNHFDLWLSIEAKELLNQA